MIVKTENYTREQIGKVVSLRANTEGLKLGNGVIERLAAEGDRSSLRYKPFPFLSPLNYLMILGIVMHYNY